jgi:type VII secretion protein EccB
VARQPTTWLQVSGHRFLVRRLECALLRGDIRSARHPLRAQTASLLIGCLVAAVVAAGCACLALLRPQTALDQARIVLGRESGALYVRVGDTWHPVLNLASARLIAATDASPQQVGESELGRTKRGPLLGIPGAPQQLVPPLAPAESVWTICDTDGGEATTVVVGPVGATPIRRLATDEATLVTPGPGSPAYLLYAGRRAVVDLADPAVLHALRLEGREPRVVSQSLLNAIPESPPVAVPRIRGAGGAVAWLPGYPVGSVLRITSAGDQLYVVLAGGVQRIGRVAADLLRFGDSQGSAAAITVAPDVIRGAPIVATLPVATFPDRPLAAHDDGRAAALCVSWSDGGVTFLAGGGLPVPAGRAPVTLSQADGRGPALDAVFLQPARSAYVRSVGLTADGSRGGTRYLVTDTGVRFAIHDDDAAHDLGLPATAAPAPWQILALLPSGPELSRQNASISRDTVVASP